jgi:hypothetical protein
VTVRPHAPLHVVLPQLPHHKSGLAFRTARPAPPRATHTRTARAATPNHALHRRAQRPPGSSSRRRRRLQRATWPLHPAGSQCPGEVRRLFPAPIWARLLIFSVALLARGLLGFWLGSLAGGRGAWVRWSRFACGWAAAQCCRPWPLGALRAGPYGDGGCGIVGVEQGERCLRGFRCASLWAISCFCTRCVCGFFLVHSVVGILGWA